MAEPYDISKLPKWAQRRMALLEMRAREADDRLRARAPAESSVRADPYSDVPLELGDPTVQFDLGAPDRHGRVPHIRVRRTDDGGLYIYASELLAIRPQSSNTCELQVVNR